ncbi:hypothetical protein HDU91_007454 [Kappamyces sp. JEL0680]|nr:hypothetical protein HDU91_007454 [Kappamyces sp. JEL0680]
MSDKPQQTASVFRGAEVQKLSLSEVSDWSMSASVPLQQPTPSSSPKHLSGVSSANLSGLPADALGSVHLSYSPLNLQQSGRMQRLTAGSFQPADSDAYASFPRDTLGFSSPRNEELDQHLLTLSNLFYSGHNIDNSFLFVALCGKPLSEKLMNAICFRASFLSKHPLLLLGQFSLSFSERLQIANSFRLNFEQDALFTGKPIDNQLLCDDIRAMLVHSLALFSIGNTAKFNHIFDSNTYWDLAPSKIVTADTLMSYLPNQGTDNPSNHLSILERQERLAILVMCILTDTFGAVSQGTDFMIDELRIPDLSFPRPDRFTPDFVVFQRQLPMTLAKNTIWEGSPLATLYDEVQEARAALRQFQDFIAFSSLGLLNDLKIFRKIIRFARTNKDNMSSDDMQATISTLHLEAIQIVDIIPNQFLPISNLHDFAPECSTPVPMPKSLGRASTELNQFYAVFLCMICYLHLPNIQAGSSTRFPLVFSDTAFTYSSKEIMFTAAKALDFLCRMAYTPIVPGQSVFGPFAGPASQVEAVLQSPLDPDLPSPLLCEATSAMMLYLISSSCLSAARIGPVNEEQLLTTQTIVQESIIPCLRRIACLWPVGKMFEDKLCDVLRG